ASLPPSRARRHAHRHGRPHSLVIPDGERARRRVDAGAGPASARASRDDAEPRLGTHDGARIRRDRAGRRRRSYARDARRDVRRRCRGLRLGWRRLPAPRLDQPRSPLDYRPGRDGPDPARHGRAVAYGAAAAVSAAGCRSASPPRAETRARPGARIPTVTGTDGLAEPGASDLLVKVGVATVDGKDAALKTAPQCRTKADPSVDNRPSFACRVSPPLSVPLCPQSDVERTT